MNKEKKQWLASLKGKVNTLVEEIIARDGLDITQGSQTYTVLARGVSDLLQNGAQSKKARKLGKAEWLKTITLNLLTARLRITHDSLNYLILKAMVDHPELKLTPATVTGALTLNISDKIAFIQANKLMDISDEEKAEVVEGSEDSEDSDEK